MVLLDSNGLQPTKHKGHTMKLYLETRYNTEATVESEDVMHLLEATIALRALVNNDSYIGFNNYLNHQCEECKGSIRLKDNVLVYILEDHNKEIAYLRAYETPEGVRLNLYTTEDKDLFLYNRMIKSIAKAK